LGTWKNEHMGRVGDVKRIDDIVLMIEGVRGHKTAVKHGTYSQIMDYARSAKQPLERLWRGLEVGIVPDENGMG
jgi:hypothetical protein